MVVKQCIKPDIAQAEADGTCWTSMELLAWWLIAMKVVTIHAVEGMSERPDLNHREYEYASRTV